MDEDKEEDEDGTASSMYLKTWKIRANIYSQNFFPLRVILFGAAVLEKEKEKKRRRRATRTPYMSYYKYE